MIPPALRDFVERLKSSTDEGRVRWQDGAQQSYFCNHKKYSVHINYHFNEDEGIGSYYMSINNGDRESNFAVQDNENDSWLIRNLFYSITVNASGMENIVDDFFD